MPPKDSGKRKSEDDANSQAKRLAGVVSGGSISTPTATGGAVVVSPTTTRGRNLRRTMPIKEKVTIFNIAGSTDLNELNPWDDDGLICNEDDFKTMCSIVNRNIEEAVSVKISAPEKGAKTDSKIDVVFSDACPYPPNTQLRFVTGDMCAEATSGLRCFGILKEDKDDKSGNKKSLADRKFTATFGTRTGNWDYRKLSFENENCGDMMAETQYQADVDMYKIRARQELLSDLMYRLLVEYIMNAIFESPLCQATERFKYYESDLWRLKSEHPEWSVLDKKIVDEHNEPVTYLHPSVRGIFFDSFIKQSTPKYGLRNVPVALESKSAMADFQKSKGAGQDDRTYVWKDWRASALPRADPDGNGTDILRVIRVQRKVFLLPQQKQSDPDPALAKLDPKKFNLPFDVKDDKQLEAWYSGCMEVLGETKLKLNPIKYLHQGGPLPHPFKPWESVIPRGSIVQVSNTVAANSCLTGFVTVKLGYFGAINIKKRVVPTGSGVEYDVDDFYKNNSGDWGSTNEDGDSSSSISGAGSAGAAGLD